MGRGAKYTTIIIISSWEEKPKLLGLTAFFLYLGIGSLDFHR